MLNKLIITFCTKILRFKWKKKKTDHRVWKKKKKFREILKNKHNCWLASKFKKTYILTEAKENWGIHKTTYVNLGSHMYELKYNSNNENTFMIKIKGALVEH